MPFCSVIPCKNKSITQNLTRGGVSYHRFPKNPDVREKWIIATGKQNWIPGKEATICSEHFEQKHFVLKTGARRYLNTLAVPTHNVYTMTEDGLEPPRHYIKLDRVCNYGNAGKLYKTNQTDFSPILLQNQNQNAQRRVCVASLAPGNHLEYDQEVPERREEVTSIEIEIIPENRIISSPQENGVVKPDKNINSQTPEDEKRVIELLRKKILEQDLLIRKLKVRNFRLKKRLFSLKSMEDTESEQITNT